MEGPEITFAEARLDNGPFGTRVVRFETGRRSDATHAAFPGPHGRVYRALILPTGFHARVVNRVLGAIRRGASRDTPRAA